MKRAVRVASRAAFALAAANAVVSVVLVYVSLLTVKVCSPGEDDPCLNRATGALPALLVMVTVLFALGLLLGDLAGEMEGDHEHRSDR